MKFKRKKKCLHCKCLYKLSKYNWDRQMYCLKPECQSVRKKQSQKNWLSKQKKDDLFSSKENIQRVQEWRKNNPGYWKRSKQKTPLQDLAFSQHFDIKRDTDIDESEQKLALQDLANSQVYLMTGLIAHLTGDALQDSVVKNMRHFIFKGQSLFDSKMK